MQIAGRSLIFVCSYWGEGGKDVRREMGDVVHEIFPNY